MAHAGVHEPPGRAARGLLTWGIELWPYVNGKALVNGLKLSSMEASDMLDVIHYYFECDLDLSTAEQAKSRDSTRELIYSDMYGRPYKYANGSGNSIQPGSKIYDEGSAGDYSDGIDADDEDIKPFNPRTEKVLPNLGYTKFDPDAPKPFGNILDAPLG
jgi:hypothetical protein